MSLGNSLISPTRRCVEVEGDVFDVDARYTGLVSISRGPSGAFASASDKVGRVWGEVSRVCRACGWPCVMVCDWCVWRACGAVAVLLLAPVSRVMRALARWVYGIGASPLHGAFLYLRVIVCLSATVVCALQGCVGAGG